MTADSASDAAEVLLAAAAEQPDTFAATPSEAPMATPQHTAEPSTADPARHTPDAHPIDTTEVRFVCSFEIVNHYSLLGPVRSQARPAQGLVYCCLAVRLASRVRLWRLSMICRTILCCRHVGSCGAAHKSLLSQSKGCVATGLCVRRLGH